MEFRTQWDDKEDAKLRKLTTTKNDDPSLTHQSMKDDCDINVIVKRMRIGETELPEPLGEEFYGAIETIVDYRTLLDYQRETQEYFNQLPPELRTRFNNNPAELWEFARNTKNTQEAIDLGIFENPNAEPAGAEPPPIPLGAQNKTPPGEPGGDKKPSKKAETTPAKNADEE